MTCKHIHRGAYVDFKVDGVGYHGVVIDLIIQRTKDCKEFSYKEVTDLKAPELIMGTSVKWKFRYIQTAFEDFAARVIEIIKW